MSNKEEFNRVGRDASTDRRFSPRPERQERLFDVIEEVIISDEEGLDNPSCSENCDPRPERQERLFDVIKEVIISDEEGLDNPSCSENCDPQVSGETNNGAQVYLRLRPLEPPSSTYVTRGKVLIVKPPSESNSTRNLAGKHFEFSDIFDRDVPQSCVHEKCVRTQIDLEENFTLLTYGTSGSGKTFTLLGGDNQPGILPRALEQIFRMYESEIYTHPSIKLLNGRVSFMEEKEMLQEVKLRDRFFKSKQKDQAIWQNDYVATFIWVSFVEIYNENVYDLLEPENTSSMAPPTRRILKIVGNDGKVFIKDLTSVYVKKSIEALDILRYGVKHVSYASTSINEHSSRSHCIFLIDVIKYFKSGQFTETSYKFCDLAGSERLQKTGNTGSRLKEAQRINASLLVLGRCLDAATNRKKNNDIIPFRDSKLTMILQAALLGKEKLTMIVNLMPTEKYYEENMNVLNFASKAQKIVVKQPAIKPQEQRRFSILLDTAQPKISSSKDKQMQQILEENNVLRKKLSEMELREKQFEDRLKIELENQKEEFKKEIRKYQREIEDLREDLKKKTPIKRLNLK